MGGNISAPKVRQTRQMNNVFPCVSDETAFGEKVDQLHGGGMGITIGIDDRIRKRWKIP
jgi:hypothetical protein